MKTERIIGFLVFLGIFISAMYFFYPSEYDSSEDALNLNNEKPSESNNITNNKPKNNQFKNFDESDFDFFVYRAHVPLTGFKLDTQNWLRERWAKNCL